MGVSWEVSQGPQSALVSTFQALYPRTDQPQHCFLRIHTPSPHPHLSLALTGHHIPGLEKVVGYLRP